MDDSKRSGHRDRKLVALCLEGDEESWAELWTRYGPVVKSVALRIGCSREEAEDVLQRVALVALQSLDRLRDPEKLISWLAGIARYQSFEVIRSRRPGEQLHTASAVCQPEVEDTVQRDHELLILRRSMVELEPRCRRMIRRLELDDPPASYRQVAEEERLAPSSVGPIRRRCLRRLGKIVTKLSHQQPRGHILGEE